MTDSGRMRPLHPTLLIQYSSSRPTYAGLMFTYDHYEHYYLEIQVKILL